MLTVGLTSGEAVEDNLILSPHRFCLISEFYHLPRSLREWPKHYSVYQAVFIDSFIAYTAPTPIVVLTLPGWLGVTT